MLGLLPGNRTFHRGKKTKNLVPKCMLLEVFSFHLLPTWLVLHLQPVIIRMCVSFSLQPDWGNDLSCRLLPDWGNDLSCCLFMWAVMGYRIPLCSFEPPTFCSHLGIFSIDHSDTLKRRPQSLRTSVTFCGSNGASAVGVSVYQFVCKSSWFRVKELAKN